MKLVIDIDEYDKEWIHDAYDIPNEIKSKIVDAIRNGTPLPENHGRLIDADVYRKELLLEIPNLDYDGSLEPYEEGIYSAIMSLDDAPTIIKANKEV